MYWPLFVLYVFYLTTAFFGLSLSLAISALLLIAGYLLTTIQKRPGKFILIEKLKAWSYPRAPRSEIERHNARLAPGKSTSDGLISLG